MAQSGKTSLSLYYSPTTGHIPVAGDLVPGELALNTADGKIYYLNNLGVVTEFAGGSGPTPPGTGGPSFSAYLSANQNATSNVVTKIICNSEEFDTGGFYNNTTGVFQPTVAGYYQINANAYVSGQANLLSAAEIYIYKNNALYKNGGYIIQAPTPDAQLTVNISSVVYLNGTTDYVDVRGRIVGTNVSFTGVPVGGTTWFNGSFLNP